MQHFGVQGLRGLTHVARRGPLRDGVDYRCNYREITPNHVSLWSKPYTRQGSEFLASLGIVGLDCGV